MEEVPDDGANIKEAEELLEAVTPKLEQDLYDLVQHLRRVTVRADHIAATHPDLAALRQLGGVAYRLQGLLFACMGSGHFLPRGPAWKALLELTARADEDGRRIVTRALGPVEKGAMSTPQLGRELLRELDRHQELEGNLDVCRDEPRHLVELVAWGIPEDVNQDVQASVTDLLRQEFQTRWRVYQDRPDKIARETLRAVLRAIDAPDAATRADNMFPRAR